MQDHIPTIRSRELGDGLRLAMEHAQLNGKQIAERLGWSQSKVSRLLTGRRGATEVEVAEFLVTCGVKGEQRSHLMSLCKDQNTKSWFQQFGARLPLAIRTYIDHEDKARRITYFAALVIPGLLQTGEYARALLHRSGTLPADEIEQTVVTRLGRHSLFSREEPPQLLFYIHEQGTATSRGW